MRQPLDAYYTPQRLADALTELLPISRGQRVLEPHAGKGAFVRAALRHTAEVHANDLDPTVADGLRVLGARSVRTENFLEMQSGPFDWVIGNPAFGAAEPHVRAALALVGPGGNVALLLRLAFLESAERHAFLVRNPPHRIWVLAGRPSFTEESTDNTEYGWFWWSGGADGRRTMCSVLQWEDGRPHNRGYTRPVKPSWPILAAEIPAFLRGLGLRNGQRVAVPEGAGSEPDPCEAWLGPRFGARASSSGDDFDWIVGAPPQRELERLVPVERSRLAPGGRLVLWLPLRALAGRHRAAFWAENPPTRVQVASHRPYTALGQGSQATALFWWDRERSDTAPAFEIAPLWVHARWTGAGRRPRLEEDLILLHTWALDGIRRDDPRFGLFVRLLHPRAQTLAEALQPLWLVRGAPPAVRELLTVLLLELEQTDEVAGPQGPCAQTQHPTQLTLPFR